MSAVKQIVRTMRRLLGRGPDSTDFQIVHGGLSDEIFTGWQSPDLPQRQLKAFAPILADLRSGKSREDFTALAEAVEFTQLDDPLIIEIGCGSGWNSEVLKLLLHHPVRYIGADYSSAMVRLGKSEYPSASFLACNATHLPLANASCDILLSGTVLLHIFDYRKAIAESRRVSRRFVIFHTVPIHERRETTVLKKRAYGEWVVEIIFNEPELLDLFNSAGMAVRQMIDSIPYDLIEITGEHSSTRTYVCEVR